MLDNYYYASPGGITYLGNNDATDGVTPLIIPFPQLLFPVNAGQVASIVGTNLSLGNDTQGNPVTGNLNYTIANADFEAVTVPAGIFPNALKQVTSTSVSGTDSVTHQTVTVTGTDTIWLVPGIGTVKEVTVINLRYGHHRERSAGLHCQRRRPWAGSAGDHRFRNGDFEHSRQFLERTRHRHRWH
jgi:hypothetical protein